MLLKALGIIDFTAGLILVFGIGTRLPHSILILLGVVFLIKSGIGLLANFASWIDFLAGIIFILLILFPVYQVICFIVGLLLIQKGVYLY